MRSPHIYSSGASGRRSTTPCPLTATPATRTVGPRPASRHRGAAAGEILTLPLYPGLNEPDQDRVIKAIASFADDDAG